MCHKQGAAGAVCRTPTMERFKRMGMQALQLLSPASSAASRVLDFYYECKLPAMQRAGQFGLADLHLHHGNA